MPSLVDYLFVMNKFSSVLLPQITSNSFNFALLGNNSNYSLKIS